MPLPSKLEPHLNRKSCLFIPGASTTVLVSEQEKGIVHPAFNSAAETTEKNMLCDAEPFGANPSIKRPTNLNSTMFLATIPVAKNTVLNGAPT